MSTNNLLGIAEIAELAGVSKQAVGNWRMRYEQRLPAPDSKASKRAGMETRNDGSLDQEL